MENKTIEGHRAGFVAVSGRPNVGKSTLINALMGQKIAAVSPRPQTTRRQQMGILTLENAQIIFTDTPGVHQPQHKLGAYMNEEAAHAFQDADLILWLVDARHPPHPEDELLAGLLRGLGRPIPRLLALNKIDQLAHGELPGRQEAFQALLPQAEIVAISARTGENLDLLLQALLSQLPLAPPYFPAEQITDAYERDIAADLIRAAALLHLRDEIPHSMAVRIDEFTERGDHGAYIRVTLFVERESQKPIVIGKGGEMLKRIGTTARLEIESMSGRKVFLELRVKVRKNWRNDDNSLRAFGFRSRPA